MQILHVPPVLPERSLATVYRLKELYLRNLNKFTYLSWTHNQKLWFCCCWSKLQQCLPFLNNACYKVQKGPLTIFSTYSGAWSFL